MHLEAYGHTYSCDTRSQRSLMCLVCCASCMLITHLDWKYLPCLVGTICSLYAQTEGMHDGGVAGIAVGLFFAGVFVTLIIWFIVSKKRGSSLPSFSRQANGSFQRMEEMKYNEYNNPTSSTAGESCD